LIAKRQALLIFAFSIMPKKTKKANFIRTIGRRKTSSARVRLHKGKGENLVNDLPIAQYFPGKIYQALYQKPFKVTQLKDKVYVTVIVEGGGKNSQLEAVTHGIARALEKFQPDIRPALKKTGLLTRDPRVKERRKAGLAQSARAKKQSPKR
jgi:small subunit ribosomal protein S9